MTTPAPAKGATMGQNVIGEVTESIHKFLIDNYDLTEQVPRFEEDRASSRKIEKRWCTSTCTARRRTPTSRTPSATGRPRS